METIYSNLQTIVNPYDGILLDAYGVFWSGNATGLYPGSRETMEKLVSAGKIVGILSNTTQLSANEISKLAKHGLEIGRHYHFLLTSGEIAYQLIQNAKLPFATPHKKYLVFGEPHPRFSSPNVLFNGSVYSEATDVNQADFIYIGIPHIEGEDQVDKDVFRQAVSKFKTVNLPVLCTNPDKYAHEGSPPQLVVRQGCIAELFEEQGSKVFYIGKPSSILFQAALDEYTRLGVDQASQILMIGDTPETDIRGAKNFGMASALITQTGIFAERTSLKSWEQLLSELPKQDYPDYFILQLADQI